MNTVILVQKEFKSDDRNPNVNGNGRLLTVTRTNNDVRIRISGVQGHGLNTRSVDLSDVTMDIEEWLQFKDVILASAEGRI